MTRLFIEQPTVVLQRKRHDDALSAQAPDSASQAGAPHHGVNEHLLASQNINWLDFESCYTNPLVQASSKILAVLATMPRQGPPQNIYAYAHQLADEISFFRGQAKSLNCHANLVEKSSFLLCGALDEAVQNQAWGQQVDWAAIGLISQFFPEQNIDEGFFILLKKALHQSRYLADFIELQYILLQLGFQGVYRYHPASELAEVNAALYEQVQKMRPTQRFPQLTTPELTPAQQPTRFTPIVRLIALGGLLLAGALALFEYTQFEQTKPLFAQINAVQDLVIAQAKAQSRALAAVSPPVQALPTWELTLAQLTSVQDADNLATTLHDAGYPVKKRQTEQGVELLLELQESPDTLRQLIQELNMRFGLKPTVREG